MNKILIFLISIFFYLSQTYAGVVPGTIQKGTSSTSVSCSTSTSSYVTSNGCNAAGQCKPYSCNPYSCNPYSCNCKTVGTGTGAVTTCSTCYNTCYSTCYQSGGESYWSSSTSYNNYHNNSVSLPYNGSIKLTNDTQTCNPRTTGVTSSADYGGYKSCSAGSCGSGGAGSWYTPYHGYCSSATSVKTIISSYDQIGNRTYSFNNSETTQYNSTRNVNLTATCQIEGRYATSDTTASTATINGVSSIFVNNDTEWCNILKYRQVGYTYKADENPGCEYYRKLNTTGNPTGTQDLLKGLEINVPSDVSGISEVQVRLGTCSYTYTPDTTALSTILVSTTSPSGVKATYTNAFTIKYDQTVTALGKSQPSLLSAFGKTRLDECLKEGKNSIAVLIKDMARSTSDGVTLSPNTGSKFTRGTINIDNSTAKLELTGDLLTTSLSGTTIGGFFNSGITNTGMWRNYTLTGNIRQGEKYEGGVHNECKSFTGALTGDCTKKLTLPTGQIRVAPAGVQADGKFMQYKCDNLGPFPDESECRPGCPSGQIWNPNTNKCEGNVCKAFVGGAEVVIEHGVNGVVSGSSCMAYCIPGHSVGCVVSGGGSSPSGGGEGVEKKYGTVKRGVQPLSTSVNHNYLKCPNSNGYHDSEFGVINLGDKCKLTGDPFHYSTAQCYNGPFPAGKYCNKENNGSTNQEHICVDTLVCLE